MVINGQQAPRPGEKDRLRRISKEQFDDSASLFLFLMKAAEQYGKDNPNASMELAFEAALNSSGIRCTNGEGRKEGIKKLVELASQAAKLVMVMDGSATGGIRVSNEMMTTQEAANYLGVCRQHVVELTNRGQLSFRMVGRYRRLLRKEVEEYYQKGLQRSSDAAAALAKRDPVGDKLV